MDLNYTLVKDHPPYPTREKTRVVTSSSRQRLSHFVLELRRSDIWILGTKLFYECGKRVLCHTKNSKMTCLTFLKEPEKLETLGIWSFQRWDFGAAFFVVLPGLCWFSFLFPNNFPRLESLHHKFQKYPFYIGENFDLSDFCIQHQTSNGLLNNQKYLNRSFHDLKLIWKWG